ncbi:MAG: cysteine--tRNA ligase [Candidatus Micrarchaeia archaeon]
MRVYNSLSREMEEFEPFEKAGKGPVIMYVCGLTPYDKAHIGHARTYVAFDMAKRWLMKGWITNANGKGGREVFHIQNITDVEDKIIKRCMETGADPKVLTKENHDDALMLFDKLNIIRANVYPKVTEHIPEIIETIQKIIKNGYAYETKTGVYFDVSKFEQYGKLSGQKMDEIKAGSRKEVDESKNNPADFALWKKTKGEIIEFDSPWGKGRPGWHIECSAMGRKYSKRTIDIHGGARDLIFPHHENEIAQSEAANREKFVKYWLHTGFLTVNGEKMSKSLGNFITISEVLSRYEPNAIRMFFALTHYRSPIDYNEDSIGAAGESAERVLNSIGLIKECLRERKKKLAKSSKFETETAALMENIQKAMENDFDTPTAIASMFNLVRMANAHIEGNEVDYTQLSKILEALEHFAWVLGLKEKIIELDEKKEQVMKVLASIAPDAKAKTVEEALDELVKLRDEARKSKDYGKSDLIRKELGDIGVLLEDVAGRTKWKLRSN